MAAGQRGNTKKKKPEIVLPVAPVVYRAIILPRTTRWRSTQHKNAKKKRANADGAKDGPPCRPFTDCQQTITGHRYLDGFWDERALPIKQGQKRFKGKSTMAFSRLACKGSERRWEPARALGHQTKDGSSSPQKFRGWLLVREFALIEKRPHGGDVLRLIPAP